MSSLNDGVTKLGDALRSFTKYGERMWVCTNLKVNTTMKNKTLPARKVDK